MRMRSHVRTIVVVALVVVALPVIGAPASAMRWEAPCDDRILAGYTTVPEMARGEGNTPREPDLKATYKAFPAGAVGAGKHWSEVVVVPVWFHVVTDGEVGDVSDADVARQVQILSDGFAGADGGYDMGFRFELAGITRTDNAEWFYARPGGKAERDMKKALRVGDMGTLNYYSTTAGEYLGWAYLPGLSDPRAYLDGIVLDWATMWHTSDQYEDRYDLGRTAVHEAGHWFGLEHTFFGGCNAHGDFVSDTPPMKIPTSGCPPDGTKDTCPKQAGFDPIHNYMDYSYDQCYTEFTAGQAARARDHWLAFRA
jgi:hypothetical protein